MPLTTIFTPASSCSERPFTYFQDDGETSTFWRDMYLEDTDCYPWSYAYQHEATVSAVYSPGVCPEAYYAAQYTANGPTGAQTSWCCPTYVTHVPSHIKVGARARESQCWRNGALIASADCRVPAV